MRARQSDQPLTTTEGISNYGAYLNESHTKVQSQIIKVVPVVCIPIYILSIVGDNCWHNWVQLFGFLAMIGAWLYGHKLSKNNRSTQSVLVFLVSVIIFQMIVMLLFPTAVATGILTDATVIVYASFHSRKLLLWGVIATIATLAIAELIRVSGVYEPKIFNPMERAIFLIAFTSVILGVLYIFLRQFQQSTHLLLNTSQVHNERNITVIAAMEDVRDTLETAVEGINEVTSSFSDRANEQVSAVEEISTAIEHVEEISVKTSTSANEAKSISKEIRQLSSSSSRKLEEVEHGFDKVVETNMVTQIEFDELAAQAESIETILRTNREIAGQIKILAVNAGIQAAKAGKYGSGFRVVANELKSMILKTDESLTHSRKILEDIRTRARQSSDAVRKGSEQLSRLFLQLGETREFISKAQVHSEKTSVDVTDINESANQQLEKIEDVKLTIHYVQTASDEFRDSADLLMDHVAAVTESYYLLHKTLSTSPPPRNDEPVN